MTTRRSLSVSVNHYADFKVRSAGTPHECGGPSPDPSGPNSNEHFTMWMSTFLGDGGIEIPVIIPSWLTQDFP